LFSGPGESPDQLIGSQGSIRFRVGWLGAFQFVPGMVVVLAVRVVVWAAVKQPYVFGDKVFFFVQVRV
jgi:hypothetical protein